MRLRDVPAVKRVLVRIEYADGDVREFEAQEPYSADAAITYPDRFRIPVVPAEMIPPAEAIEVEVSIRAYRHPVVVRTFRPASAEIPGPQVQPDPQMQTGIAR